MLSPEKTDAERSKPREDVGRAEFPELGIVRSVGAEWVYERYDGGSSSAQNKAESRIQNAQEHIEACMKESSS